MSLLKRCVLSALERAGYVLLKQHDFEALHQERHKYMHRANELQSENDALNTANEKLWDDNAKLEETASQLRINIADLQGDTIQAPPDRDYQWLMAHQHLRASLKDLDPAFGPIYEQCRAYTMTSAERLFALYKAIKYIVQADIPGDIAECGVWRGGSMMLAATTLLAEGKTNRRLLLYDTFEGHVIPDPEKDVDIWGGTAVRDWEKYARPDGSSDWARASLDETRKNLESTGYPVEKVIYIKGKIEKTLPQSTPETLALLRLDTDWHASTCIALETLYPQLSPGGVLIVDDYGHYHGQRKAVDEFFDGRGGPILLNRIDYSCRLAVKPGNLGR